MLFAHQWYTCKNQLKKKDLGEKKNLRRILWGRQTDGVDISKVNQFDQSGRWRNANRCKSSSFQRVISRGVKKEETQGKKD